MHSEPAPIWGRLLSFNEQEKYMATDPVQQLKDIRTGYLNALAADALNPIPSHNIDGIQIDATAWRRELLDRIAQLNVLICAFEPQELHSVII